MQKDIGNALDVWPFWGLKLRTPRLELRFASDQELLELGNLAAEKGIHDPKVMPFSNTWSRLESPELQRSILQFNQSIRGELKAEDWHLGFVAFLDGQPIGSQGVMSKNFAVARSFETGSWMTRNFHGQGLGKEMRAAILHLGFDHLGAQRAETSANFDNESSIGVTRSLGYEPNGAYVDVVEDKATEVRRFVMTKKDWMQSAARSIPVEVEGVAACLPLLVKAKAKEATSDLGL